MEFLLRLDENYLKNSVYVTLTYPVVVPPREAKHHLKNFCRILQKKYPHIAVVWRFEVDSRGERDYHPHFHLLILGITYIDKEEIDKTWERVTGQDVRYACKVMSVSRLTGLVRYLLKYFAKPSAAASGGGDGDGNGSDDGDGALGLVNVSYFPGRAWGIYFRNNLKYCKMIIAMGGLEVLRVVYELKRYLRILLRNSGYWQKRREMLYGSSGVTVYFYNLSRLVEFCAR